jgi:hypothetical protein
LLGCLYDTRRRLLRPQLWIHEVGSCAVKTWKGESESDNAKTKLYNYL